MPYGLQGRRLAVAQPEHLAPDGWSRYRLEWLVAQRSQRGFELVGEVTVADPSADELVGVDAERERLLLRSHAPGESDIPCLPAERLQEALLRLVVDRAEKLDGPENPDADERVPETPAEPRQHGERHLDFHAEYLTALDEKLAEKLVLVRRGHALGRSLDEEDAPLALPFLEDERAGLPPYGEVKEARW